jgi:AcrR family transcriptional regulator
VATSERSLTDLIHVVPGRQRLTADARREAIVDAAWAVFARNGFHRASTQEIAASAGCSEPMIYKHFPSKQALFAAVLERGKGCVKKRFDELLVEREGDPEAAYAADPLGTWAAIMKDLVLEPIYAQTARLRLFALALADDPEIGAALGTQVSRQHEMGSQALALAQDNGTARSDLEPDVGSWLIAATSMVAAVRNATEGEDGLREMPEFIDTLVRLLRPPSDLPEEGTA